MEMEQFFTTYLIPSGLIVAALTYLFKVSQNYKNNAEELRSKRLTLIEKLDIDFIRINTLFESLRNDAELNGYFGFKNINSIRPMVARIQSITTDELAVFEEDERLRREIINIGDFLSSLLIDFDNLENVAQAQTNKEIEDANKFNDELKKLRRSVLRYGLQITAGLHIVNPSGDDSDKHYNAALSALSELRDTYNSSSNTIARMREVLKDRRFFYSIKCLDSQNQLRSLISLLEEAKKKYVKRSLILRLLNRIT